ncbi:hypothetical protein P9112_012596 [Eukaryota sp. TZLM1-RC]
MSCHVMTDVTRYPPATHSQSSSTKDASRSPSVSDTEPNISAMSKEIEDRRSRLSQVSSHSQAFAEASDSDTEPIQAIRCSTPVCFRPPDDPAEDADSYPSDSPNLPGLASFELRNSSEEDRLFEAMLSYVPYTIAPIVLETFEICYGIDTRSHSTILTHLMSMCHPSVSLSVPTADEAVTSYITQFLKLVRICPSLLPESARMKFFSNGIRPDKLKMVIKTAVSFTGSLNSVRRPFESLHCDSIGPLSADTDCYKYIVHFVDAFSNFSILVPTKDLKATTYVLISSVYSVFGSPRRIHSDNGPDFSNKIFSLLCQFLNIEHSQSLPHYHQSNDLVERQHRSFLQVIRRMLLDFSDYHNWSDYVPLCQMLLNSQERKADDRVFVLCEKPDKLHGHFVGPYVVLKVLLPSSLLVQNPVSGSSFKTASHLVKPCLSSLPPEILDAYAAADSGELMLDAIIDITDESATVLWSDGTTTVQPVSSIQNTAAYFRYIKLAADPPKSHRKKSEGSLKRVEHVKYELFPFAVSLFWNIASSGIKFLQGFRSLIKERAGKELNFNLWHNRIVFSILKAIAEMLTTTLLQLGIEYENRALKRIDEVDARIEHIEF